MRRSAKMVLTKDERFSGADCMLTSEDVSILLGCTLLTAREFMKYVLPSINFGNSRQTYKVRKFAFNETIKKLDGKNLLDVIAAAKEKAA